MLVDLLLNLSSMKKYNLKNLFKNILILLIGLKSKKKKKKIIFNTKKKISHLFFTYITPINNKWLMIYSYRERGGSEVNGGPERDNEGLKLVFNGHLNIYFYTIFSLFCKVPLINK